MNRLILLTGVAILVAATSLFNTTTAYGCNNSSGTNQTNSTSGMDGNLTKSNAFVNSGHVTAVSSPCNGEIQINKQKHAGID